MKTFKIVIKDEITKKQRVVIVTARDMGDAASLPILNENEYICKLVLLED